MWQLLPLLLGLASLSSAFGMRQLDGKCSNFYDHVCNSAFDGDADQGPMERVKEQVYSSLYSYVNDTQTKAVKFSSQDDNFMEEYGYIEKELVGLCSQLPESIESLYWLAIGGEDENCEERAIKVADEVFNRQGEFGQAKKKYKAMTEAAGFMKYLSHSLSFERQQKRAQELFERAKNILLERMEKHITVPEFLEEAKETLSKFVLYQWKPVNVDEILDSFEKRLNKCLEKNSRLIESVRRYCFIWAQENSLYDGISRLGTLLLHELGHVIYRTAWVSKPVTKCIVERKEESCQQLGKDNTCKNGHFTLVEDFCDWISDALAIEILRENYKQKERFKRAVERYYYNRAHLACTNKKHSTNEQTTAHSINPIRVNAVLGRTALFSEIHNCSLTKQDKEKANRCEIL